MLPDICYFNQANFVTYLQTSICFYILYLKLHYILTKLQNIVILSLQFMCFSPEEYKDDIVSSPVKRFRPKPDLTNSNPDQNQFLLNLDLLESNLINEYLSILRAQDVKKRQREFLYVPEVSDKKFRFVKHFLFLLRVKL